MLVISMETPKKHIFYIRGTRLKFEKNTYHWSMAKEAVEAALGNWIIHFAPGQSTIVTSDMSTVDLLVREKCIKLNKKMIIYRTDLSIEIIDENGKSKILGRKIECTDGNVLSAINKTIKNDLSKDDLDVHGCWVGFTKNSVADTTKMYISPEQVKTLYSFSL